MYRQRNFHYDIIYSLFLYKHVYVNRSSGGYFASKLVKKLNDTDLRTLVLWGEQDQILDPKLYVKRFEEDLPMAEISMVDECGHVMHLEKPEVTAEQILGFM